MLKHAIRSKGQTINFIFNSYALFNLRSFYLRNDTHPSNKTDDVKNYAVTESTKKVKYSAEYES